MCAIYRLGGTAFCILFLYVNLPTEAYREARALVYPKGGVYKFIVGLGVPIDRTRKLLSMILNIQFQYSLPQNITVLKNYPEVQRSLQEKVNRGKLYQALQIMMDRNGGHGRSCLLRTICEAAETPLHHNGLVGEILHAMLTPGYGSNMNEILHSEFHEARNLGEEGGNCQLTYPSCPFGHGLLDMISLIDRQSD